jgi:hypothetical protein
MVFGLDENGKVKNSFLIWLIDAREKGARFVGLQVCNELDALQVIVLNFFLGVTCFEDTFHKTFVDNSSKREI